MKPLYVIATCAFVLAAVYAPAEAMTTSSSGGSGWNDDTWKKVAIIVPIVFGGITTLLMIWFCCCRGGGGGGMGGCDCRGCGLDNCFGCGPGCRNCCYGCDDCCNGCCYVEDGRHRPNMVYSSHQGPVQLESAYSYGHHPPPQVGGIGFSNEYTNVSSMGVNGVERYQPGVYGGIRPGGFSSSGGPGGGCGCGPAALPKPGGCGCGGGGVGYSPYNRY